jgi:hypothetical protein
MTNINSTNTDIRIFGSDMRLYDNDIKVSSKGDIDVLQSYDNLAQALRHRLTTEKGFLPYDQDYGIDLGLFLGRKNLFEKQEMLKFAILQSLKREARIQTIDNILIYQDSNNPTILYANVTVTPMNVQDKLSLNLVFPWYVTTQIESVVDEPQTSTSKTTVNTDYDIHSVVGVWITQSPHYTYNRQRDAIISGTNYYTPSGTFLGKTITLSSKLKSTFTNVYVSYNRYVAETTS